MTGGFTANHTTYPALHTQLVYANDIEPTACAIFAANFPITPDRTDIRTLDPSTIPAMDVLTGGFPCQSFSVVAQNPKRLGITDAKGQLFFEMCRILGATQPAMFVAENVKGILSANNGDAFPLILEAFQDCGYQVQWPS